MSRIKIRQFILGHSLSRELFFYIGKRKANIKKVDKIIDKGKISFSQRKEVPLIISLTSYGERIKELKYTLYSLISQSVRAEKIIVNVAYEDMQYIDSGLRLFEKYDVEFNPCFDLKSYKKLIPTIVKYPNKIIVTADDDLFYSKYWLEKIWEEHCKYPNYIIGNMMKKITFTGGRLNPYSQWIFNYKSSEISNFNFLLGGSGTLYPPNCLYKDASDVELINSLCPYADDIWFYFMTLFNNTKSKQVTKPETNLRYVNPYREYGIIEGKTLTQENVYNGKNDIQFRKIMEYYNISDEDLLKMLEED